MRKSGFTEAQITGMFKEQEVGMPTAEMCRRHGLTKAADLLEEHCHETLTYYGFPGSHWIKLRTNNPLERITSYARKLVTA